MKRSFQFSAPGMGIFLLLVIVAFLAWASFFQIDQIVRAQGQVIALERTQVIQAADGGVLKELHVVEGQSVKKGQLLAVLESDRAQAGADEARNRIAGLHINRLRAKAEVTGVQPMWGAYEKSHPELVGAQKSLHQQNMSALSKEVKALAEQLKLAQEELKLSERLYAEGDISRIEFMRAERMVIEVKQRMDAVQERFRVDASKEATKIEEELSSQTSKLQERQSVLDHTVIEAPTSGVVKILRINTLGGVLRQGDELMQISPTEGQYIVEAKVSPADVGQLSIGQAVILKFDAFDYSIYGSLRGQLNYLSPDTFSEQGSEGRSAMFYRAQVVMDERQTGARIEPAQIKPGMTVSLDILSSQRSVLTYIAKPITRAFSGALGQR